MGTVVGELFSGGLSVCVRGGRSSVGAFFCAVWLLWGQKTGATEVGDCLDGLITRGTGLYSACVDFEYRDSTSGDESQPAGSTPTSASSDAKVSPQSLVLSVQGEDWVLRYQGAENFRMTRQQASVTLTSVLDRMTGEPSRTLLVEAPVPLREWMAQEESCRVWRLGAIPWERQLEFLERQRSVLERVGTERIGANDCEVLRCPVDRLDFDSGFVVLPLGLAQEKKGWLRIAVAPDLGFALVRMEYLTASGMSLVQWTSDDFRSVGDDTYFPFRSRLVTKLPRGQRVQEYLVREVTHWNAALPDYTFSLQVPFGTRVRDSRPGVPSTVFTLEDQPQLEMLNRVLAPDTPESSSPFWRNLILLLNGMGLLCLVIYWVYVR